MTALALIVGWWAVLGLTLKRLWHHEQKPRGELFDWSTLD